MNILRTVFIFVIAILAILPNSYAQPGLGVEYEIGNVKVVGAEYRSRSAKCY